jgi:uncharacterized protein (DUF1778 family)
MAATDRIELRVDPEAKRLIERAAAEAGLSVSDFIRFAALEEADRRLRRSESVTTVSPEAFDALVAALDDPPTPNDRSRRAIQHANDRLSGPQ